MSLTLGTEPLAFGKGIKLFILDDTGIIFDEARQKLFELNTTATFVWCQIEEGLTQPELAKALVGTFGFSTKEAREHVRRLVEEWRDRAFLDGSSSEDDSPKESASPISSLRLKTTVMPEIDEARGRWRERNYEILDQRYRLLFDKLVIGSWVCPVLRHLERPSEAKGAEPSTFYVTGHDETFFVGSKTGQAYCCGTIDAIAPLVKMILFSDALSKVESKIAIHAGAVGYQRRALVFPGPAGRGKSTLVAALVDEGLQYLSDDLVMLDAEMKRVRGVPFSLGIKEAGVDVLTDRFPQLPDLALHLRPDGKRVRYLAPAVGQETAAEEYEIGWIIFPRFDPTAPTELKRISASSALVKLTESCTLWRPMPWQSVGRLVSLVAAAPCFEMPFSILDEAVCELLKLSGLAVRQDVE